MINVFLCDEKAVSFALLLISLVILNNQHKHIGNK